MKKEINKYQVPDFKKRNKVTTLREGGKTFVEIGKLVGISPQRAGEIYNNYVERKQNNQTPKDKAS